MSESTNSMNVSSEDEDWDDPPPLLLVYNDVPSEEKRDIDEQKLFHAIKLLDLVAVQKHIATKTATFSPLRTLTDRVSLNHPRNRHKNREQLPSVIKIAVTLLEAKADPNAIYGSDQYSPFHIAVARGHANLVSLLLDHKADPRLKTREPTPRTAVKISTDENWHDISSMLGQWKPIAPTPQAPPAPMTVLLKSST